MGTQPILEEWIESHGYEDGIDSAPNSSGLTPLMQAARKDEAEIVASLLEAGVDVHATNPDGN